jgi:predicted TIM-barrel fold metal-dependent hydrolase
MGNVDLSFKPSVPVFDANVALGRRHNKRVRSDTVAGALAAMKHAGVDRAVAYSPHAVAFDPHEGNELLLELIDGESGFVPQFVCNPSYDDLDGFAAQVAELGIRSVRIDPSYSNYPFRDWVVKPWLDWLAAEKIPLFLPAAEFDPSELHDTLKAHPDVSVVLCEVMYGHVNWVLPLLRSLPNVSVEISRWVITDGIARLLDAVGHKRIIYGSRFPEPPGSMAPQLYMLHRCGLSDQALRDICSGNLSGLLGYG